MHDAIRAAEDLLATRPKTAAFLAGCAAVLAMPPLFVWPVLFASLVALVRLLDFALTPRSPSQSRWLRLRRATILGWWFGFGYFALGLYWLSASLLVEPEKFAWLLPFSVTLIPAGLAVFHAGATALAGVLWRPGFARILALAIGFGTAEWLRGHVLTGFPWNALGYALTAPSGFLQAASVFGVHGLTVLAVLVFAAPAVWFDRPRQSRERRPAVRALPVIWPLAALALAAVAGAVRLSAPAAPAVPGVALRLLQPNISQQNKWRQDNKDRIFTDYLAASRKDASGRTDNLAGITHLIWPESAIPFLLLQTPSALDLIAAMLPSGATLITGAVRLQEPAPSDAEPNRRRIFNSILALDDQARLVAVYDKVHLVPFGEYLPFQPLMEKLGIQQLTKAPGGFSSGAAGARSMMVAGLPGFAPLICYEVIFADEVVPRGARPNFLLNVTNDGWFGATAGPHQHFHQARVRAVEQGLPLVRVANTGMSAVVDGYGRVLQRLALNRSGVIDSPLPLPLAPTVYARWGDWVLMALLMASLAAWLGCTRWRS